MRTQVIVDALREIEFERRAVLDRLEELEDERAALRRRAESLEAAARALAPLREWDDVVTPLATAMGGVRPTAVAGTAVAGPAVGGPAMGAPAVGGTAKPAAGVVAPPSSTHFLGGNAAAE
jgi:hypothetical protein